MINIIVLMAGRGDRFSKYSAVSKPFIRVRGKTLMEHCTSSIPFILHDFGHQRKDVNLWFAMREKDSIHLPYMQKKYGTDIKDHIVLFDQTTRGNLETAYMVTKYMGECTGPLYVFDCDNKFDSYPIAQSLTLFNSNWANRSIAFGYNHSNPLDTKWANAKIISSPLSETPIVHSIREKDSEYAIYPRLIGIFAFSSVAMFSDIARGIIERNETSGNGEFYMSKSILPGSPFILIDHFIPLGVPDDVKNFEENI